MTYKLNLSKYKITLFGFLGSLLFAFLCVLLYFFDLGELIFPMLYIPGAIFGFAMTIALRNRSDKHILIFVLSTVEYLAMIFFCFKGFEYLVLRRILMGGLGALIFLFSVNFVTNLKFDFIDYIFGFFIGLVTTIFMWTDNFETINPWLTILSVILWQTFIAMIINRRQLMLENETKK